MTKTETTQKIDELTKAHAKAVIAEEFFMQNVLHNNDNLVDIHNNLKNAVTLLTKEIRFLKFGKKGANV